MQTVDMMVAIAAHQHVLMVFTHVNNMVVPAIHVIDPSAEDANYGGSCADAPVCGDGVCEDGEVGGDDGCYADCGCLEGEFECAAGGTYGNCIPASWQCDGYDDCADAVDETGCDDLTCEDQGWYGTVVMVNVYLHHMFVMDLLIHVMHLGVQTVLMAQMKV